MEKNGNSKKICLVGIGAVIVFAIAAIGVSAGKNNGKNKDAGGMEESEGKSQIEGNVQDKQSEGESDMQNAGNGQGGTGKAEEDAPIIAMYIPFGEGGHIFIGEQAGVFTAAFPDEIYDVEGNKITKEQLVKGNIVKIYGNGMMLESYPGQYPGITRMEVAEDGQPSDADVYQDILNEIYQEPDPAEPPSLNVEYADSLAVVAVMIGRGGYEWVYMDKDGLSNAVVEDSAHVLDWKEIADIVIDEPVDLMLYFSLEPQDVEVVRYDSSLSGKAKEMPEGEKIAVEKKDGKLMLGGVATGYIYDVTGIWENGRANYGFVTVSRTK